MCRQCSRELQTARGVCRLPAKQVPGCISDKPCRKQKDKTRMEVKLHVCTPDCSYERSKVLGSIIAWGAHMEIINSWWGNFTNGRVKFSETQWRQGTFDLRSWSRVHWKYRTCQLQTTTKEKQFSFSEPLSPVIYALIIVLCVVVVGGVIGFLGYR